MIVICKRNATVIYDFSKVHPEIGGKVGSRTLIFLIG